MAKVVRVELKSQIKLEKMSETGFNRQPIEGHVVGTKVHDPPMYIDLLGRVKGQLLGKRPQN